MPESETARPAPQPRNGDGGPAKRAQERQLAEQRKREVCRLNLDGWTTQEIADEIGVVARTVRRDLARVRAEWRADQQAFTHEHVERELASIQRDEKDVRDRLVNASEDRDYARLHEVLLKQREARRKLLGLDAPTKIEAVVAAVPAPLPVEKDPELERLVRETAARLCAPEPLAIEDAPKNGANGNGANGNGTHDHS